MLNVTVDICASKVNINIKCYYLFVQCWNHLFFVISEIQIRDFKCLPYCIVNTYDYKENLRYSVLRIYGLLLLLLLLLFTYAEKTEITCFLYNGSHFCINVNSKFCKA
jgi:hypothetical protein